MSDLHFRKDPIVEAIINLEVPQWAVSMDQLQAIQPAVSKSYPVRTPVLVFKTEIKPGAELPEAFTTQEQIGWQYRSADERHVVQTRTTGFSFHRLAPYDRWTTFKSEAMAIWRIYKRLTGDPAVESYTLRYINRFAVPQGESMDRYFNVYPEVKGSLPQIANSFMLRLELPIADAPPGSLLVMHQSLLPASEAGRVHVLLDNEFRFPAPAAASEEELWELLETARRIKNKTFKDCITPAMEEITS